MKGRLVDGQSPAEEKMNEIDGISGQTTAHRTATDVLTEQLAVVACVASRTTTRNGALSSHRRARGDLTACGIG